MTRYIAWGIVAILLVLVWLTNPSPEPEPPEHIKAILKLAKEVETNPKPEIKKAIDTTWKYQTSEDEMTSKKIHLASVFSLNTVNFDFPYSGEQRAKLILRNHPRHGVDLILTIEKGQFNCGLSGCDVLIRFNDNQPITVKASESESNKSTMLFLDAYNLLVENLPTTKTVKISANFYHEGNNVFEFDVSNFKESEFIKK
jgi:hypothetical protein